MADLPRKDETNVEEKNLPVIPEESSLDLRSAAQEFAEPAHEEEDKSSDERSRRVESDSFEALLLPDEEGAISLQYATVDPSAELYQGEEDKSSDERSLFYEGASAETLPLPDEEGAISLQFAAVETLDVTSFGVEGRLLLHKHRASRVSFADSSTSTSSDLGTISMFWPETAIMKVKKKATLKSRNTGLEESSGERRSQEMELAHPDDAEAGPSGINERRGSPEDGEIAQPTTPEARVMAACRQIKRACEDLSNNIGLVRQIYDRIASSDPIKYMKWQRTTSPTRMVTSGFEIIQKLRPVEEASSKVPFSPSVYSNKKGEISTRCMYMRKYCSYLYGQFWDIRRSLTYKRDPQSLRFREQLRASCDFLKRMQNAFESALNKLEEIVFEEANAQQQLQPLAVDVGQLLNVLGGDQEDENPGLLRRMCKNRRVRLATFLGICAVSAFFLACAFLYTRQYRKDARVSVDDIKFPSKPNATKPN